MFALIHRHTRFGVSPSNAKYFQHLKSKVNYGHFLKPILNFH